MQNSDLLKYCENLLTATHKASSWVADNEFVVNKKSSSSELQKVLRLTSRELNKCKQALNRKMCVGVFGPSQSGKSYLISVLARDKSAGTLIAKFGQTEKDFRKEINPPGGKESTGVVTRFTTTPLVTPDIRKPVHIRLLNEIDLVKIIANTYYADCDHKGVTPQEQRVREVIQLLRSKTVATANNSHIGSEDLEELHEYLYNEFSGKARIQMLEKDFWSDLFELIPLLSLNDRVTLYSLIWDEIPEFTELLTSLLNVLCRLSYATEVYCPIDSLDLNRSSIINVDTLKKRDNQSTLALLSNRGIELEVPRWIVAALTAELMIESKNSDALFEHTDLLDFPGYRAREKSQNLKEELHQKPNLLMGYFLRGKVAYLFQRYCAEKELSSVLLCVGPSNQEVNDLPSVITDWINKTFGATPEKRQNQATSLLYVLTKFDMDFGEGMSATDTSRWHNRLSASFLDYFKQFDWPQNWHVGMPFNDVYPLRNPNYPFEGVMDCEYDEKQSFIREIGISEKRELYVESLKKIFLETESIQKHIKDPARAWSELMRVQDGGVSYLIENLTPLCNPAIRDRQIEAVLNDFASKLFAELSKYYVDGDLEKILIENKKFIASLMNLYRRRDSDVFSHRFGELISAFNLRIQEVEQLKHQSLREFNRYVTESQQVVQTDKPSDEQLLVNYDSLESFFNDDMEDETSSHTPQKDIHSFYVDAIIQHLEHKMRSLADSDHFAQSYGISRADLTKLVFELNHDIRKKGIATKLHNEFKLIDSFHNRDDDDILRNQAAFACAEINNYFSWLGRGPRMPKEKRMIGNLDAFPPRKALSVPIELDETNNPKMARDYWFKGWLLSLNDLVMANMAGGDINHEQNARLKLILQMINAKN